MFIPIQWIYNVTFFPFKIIINILIGGRKCNSTNYCYNIERKANNPMNFGP